MLDVVKEFEADDNQKNAEIDILKSQILAMEVEKKENVSIYEIELNKLRYQNDILVEEVSKLRGLLQRASERAMETVNDIQEMANSDENESEPSCIYVSDGESTEQNEDDIADRRTEDVRE